MSIYTEINDSITSSPVLVVDDDELIRTFVSAYLEQAGFENILFADNGAEALEIIAAKRPVGVVLDISMPVMDGTEVLHRLRADPETADLPILVTTSRDSKEDRNSVLRAGATNMISKPIDGEILVERLTHMVEHKLLIDNLSQFHDRLQSELSLAAEMQIDLMPTEEDIAKVEGRYGVRLSNHFRTSSELGGDSWTLEEIDDTRFGILMIDFSGHGISAALNTFRLNTVLGRIGPCKASPAEYLADINNEMAGMLPLGQYCTALYALVDIEQNTLTFSGAGAPSPIYGALNGADVEIGDASGLPVGIRKGSVYDNHVVAFPENSFLFVYSDALYETERGDDGSLEIEGVAALTGEHRKSDAKAALDDILAVFFKGAPDPLPDDLTAVFLSR